MKKRQYGLFYSMVSVLAASVICYQASIISQISHIEVHKLQWKQVPITTAALTTSLQSPHERPVQWKQVPITTAALTASLQSPHERPVHFQMPELNAPLEDTYITLFLHQVHSWFGGDTGMIKLDAFLDEAKEAGFGSVMADIPWAWTEREEGTFDFNSFSKDWVGKACAKGLRVNVLLTAREFPPWVSEEFKQQHSSRSHGTGLCAKTSLGGPSLGSDMALNLVSRFVDTALAFYQAEYGDCIVSFSPSLNNEFETRYMQTHDCMRDYSPGMIEKFENWQGRAGFVPQKAPHLNGVQCKGSTSQVVHRWLEFRNVRLAEVYGDLCMLVASSKHRCMLHFGELFTTVDYLNGNPLNMLARLPQITDLILDSNMALMGAPSSPSVVGLMVDAVRHFNKTIHYEAATERIIICDASGNVVTSSDAGAKDAAQILYRSGIRRALESGCNVLGFTNLCKPSLVKQLLPSPEPLSSLRAARGQQPTAILFVPYRAFSGISFMLTGLTCGMPKVLCWHPTFEKLPRFNKGNLVEAKYCLQDGIQHGILAVWDMLRSRHQQVTVITEARDLNVHLLSQAYERVMFRIPEMMPSKGNWRFFDGIQEELSFLRHHVRYNFDEIVLGNGSQAALDVLPESVPDVPPFTPAVCAHPNVAVCYMKRDDSRCELNFMLPTLFDDSEYGGPQATTREACSSRAKDWCESCKQVVGSVHLCVAPEFSDLMTNLETSVATTTRKLNPSKAEDGGCDEPWTCGWSLPVHSINKDVLKKSPSYILLQKLKDQNLSLGVEPFELAGSHVSAYRGSKGQQRFYQKLGDLFVAGERDTLAKAGLSTFQLPDYVHNIADDKGSVYMYRSMSDADEIIHDFQRSGKIPQSGENWMDFGGSHGRVTHILQAAYPATKWYCADPIDSSIQYGRKILPDIQFYTSEQEPPMKGFSEGQFTGVYAVSIWSHYNEESAILWFQEMHRIIHPGGLLWFSTHGFQSINFGTLEAAVQHRHRQAMLESLYLTGFYYFPMFQDKGDWGLKDGAEGSSWGFGAMTTEWLATHLFNSEESQWSMKYFGPGESGFNQDVYVIQRN